jgi:hypothetical protein
MTCEEREYDVFTLRQIDETLIPIFIEKWSSIYKESIQIMRDIKCDTTVVEKNLKSLLAQNY